MLSLVILATTLWICPGEVFSNEPREGCRPFEEQSGTMSTNPEVPPDPRETDPASTAPSGMRRDRQPAPDSVNEEMCALYKEYIQLELKTQGGFQAGSPTELERWQTLKRMFQNSPAPRCS